MNLSNYHSHNSEYQHVRDDAIPGPLNLRAAVAWTIIRLRRMAAGLHRRVDWVTLVGCQLALWQALVAFAIAADKVRSDPGVPPPAYRVETEGFAAREADIRAVLDSASRELWRFFPDYKIEPIAVTRGHSGPITLYRRNERGEIVMRLDTEKTYWAQYAYQFAHEFCHILCGYRDGYQGHRWFEETLCEAASLYVIRSMSRTWKTSPPYAHWSDFRDSLRDYVDDIVKKREKIYEIYAGGLAEFYRVHQPELEADPVSRELNGAMAVVLLHLFEAEPERWEAIRWLNSTPPQKGDSFATYLQHWHDAVPPKHRPFVQRIAGLFGVDAEVIKKDVGRVFLKLEQLQDQQIADALTPREPARKRSDRDHDAALELLKDPDLLQRITADSDACGVVGEETSRPARNTHVPPTCTCKSPVLRSPEKSGARRENG